LLEVTGDAIINGHHIGKGGSNLGSNLTLGYQALISNTTGSHNTALGYQTLKNNTTGSGNFVAASVTAAGTYSPVYDITTEDNRIVMGHTDVTHAYIQVPWTVVSDARDKTEIKPLGLGLDFVSQLKPVSYKFRRDRNSKETDGRKHYGFLAQDILELEGDAPPIRPLV
jgi:hypothetical protein